MDVTQRLIDAGPPPAEPPARWPAVGFAGGAVLGVLLALGTGRVDVETLGAVEGQPLRARLTVQFAGRTLKDELSTDIPRLQSAMSAYSFGLLAGGLVGGGLAGLAGLWAARHVGRRLAGPAA
jgi:hypothetical protein